MREPVVKIMKFVSLLNSQVDVLVVRQQGGSRPQDWVHSDVDHDNGKKLANPFGGGGMPSFGGFGSNKKNQPGAGDADQRGVGGEPAERPDSHHADGDEAAPAMDMQR